LKQERTNPPKDYAEVNKILKERGVAAALSVDLSHQSIFNANWITRAASPVEMIVCVVGGATVWQHVCANTVERMLGEPDEASRGLSKFAWFNALNISARNC